MTRLRVCCLLALALGALTVGTAAATAAAVPGATYTGTAADGATLVLTVSSDGSTVSSYDVTGILGTDAHGQTCQGTVNLNPSGWKGAAISNSAFQDASLSDFTIAGSFAGSTVSGTFDLDQVPVAAATGCSTGSVSFTASAPTSPAPSSTPTTTSSTTTTASSGGTPVLSASKRASIRVRVRLRRVSAANLTGSLAASSTACTARRTVYLWSGRRLLATKRATKKGSFTFLLPHAWLGLHVHVSVRASSSTAETCVAGSSSTLRG